MVAATKCPMINERRHGATITMTAFFVGWWPTMEENWKHVCIPDRPDLEEIYEVSDMGRVRSLPHFVERRGGGKYMYRGRVLATRYDTLGYQQVVLCRHGRQKSYKVHRLVITAFVGPCPDGYEVDHINYQRGDNRLSNLRYVTHAENTAHSYEHIIAANKLNNRSKRRPIEAYELASGKTVKSYDAFSDAKNDGFALSAISLVLNGSKHQYRGYGWRYAS